MRYRVTIKGMNGYKEFNTKYEFRDWLMSWMAKHEVVDMTIKKYPDLRRK